MDTSPKEKYQIGISISLNKTLIHLEILKLSLTTKENTLSPLITTHLLLEKNKKKLITTSLKSLTKNKKTMIQTILSYSLHIQGVHSTFLTFQTHVKSILIQPTPSTSLPKQI